MRTAMKRLRLALCGAVLATLAVASLGSEAGARPAAGGGGEGPACVACQFDFVIRRHNCEAAELFGYSSCVVSENWGCSPGGSCAQTLCKPSGPRCGAFYPSLTEVPIL